jgi:hypothetical protein
VGTGAGGVTIGMVLAGAGIGITDGFGAGLWLLDTAGVRFDAGAGVRAAGAVTVPAAAGDPALTLGAAGSGTDGAGSAGACDA